MSLRLFVGELESLEGEYSRLAAEDEVTRLEEEARIVRLVVAGSSEDCGHHPSGHDRAGKFTDLNTCWQLRGGYKAKQAASGGNPAGATATAAPPASPALSGAPMTPDQFNSLMDELESDYRAAVKGGMPSATESKAPAAASGGMSASPPGWSSLDIPELTGELDSLEQEAAKVAGSSTAPAGSEKSEPAPAAAEKKPFILLEDDVNQAAKDAIDAIPSDNPNRNDIKDSIEYINKGWKSAGGWLASEANKIQYLKEHLQSVKNNEYGWTGSWDEQQEANAAVAGYLEKAIGILGGNAKADAKPSAGAAAPSSAGLGSTPNDIINEFTDLYTDPTETGKKILDAWKEMAELPAPDMLANVLKNVESGNFDLSHFPGAIKDDVAGLVADLKDHAEKAAGEQSQSPAAGSKANTGDHVERAKKKVAEIEDAFPDMLFGSEKTWLNNLKSMLSSGKYDKVISDIDQAHAGKWFEHLGEYHKDVDDVLGEIKALAVKAGGKDTADTKPKSAGLPQGKDDDSFAGSLAISDEMRAIRDSIKDTVTRKDWRGWTDYLDKIDIAVHDRDKKYITEQIADADKSWSKLNDMAPAAADAAQKYLNAAVDAIKRGEAAGSATSTPRTKDGFSYFPLGYMRSSKKLAEFHQDLGDEDLKDWKSAGIASLQTYTAHHYEEINKFLRGLSEHLSPMLKDHGVIQNLSAALKKTELGRDVVVYRGTRNLRKIDIDASDLDSLIGKRISDKGFLSTSVSPDVARSFSKKIEEGNIKESGAIFRIKASADANGASTDDKGEHTDEREVIFDKDHKIEVTGWHREHIADGFGSSQEFFVIDGRLISGSNREPGGEEGAAGSGAGGTGAAGTEVRVGGGEHHDSAAAGPASGGEKAAAGGGKEGPEFPAKLTGLKVVKSLGGSTGAKLLEDDHGNKWVRKHGASPEHLVEEDTADRVYRAMGVPVPESKVYAGAEGGKTKLAAFVPGRTLADVEKSDPAVYEQAVKELRKNFVLDAVLGNWDVVGLAKDNVIVGDDGKVYRIDNGGSLRYRAQGEKKKDDQFRPITSELKSMQDSSMNKAAASVYKGMSHEEIKTQAQDIIDNRKKILKAIAPSDSMSEDAVKLRNMVSDRITGLMQSIAYYQDGKL